LQKIFTLKGINMKRSFIFTSSIFLILLFIVQVSQAQGVKSLKTRGPMFITSASFFQAVTRIPYNVDPMAENEPQNGKNANISTISISQFFGFQFNPYLALGVGVGFDYWTTNNAFVPLYVDFRVNMTSGKIAPHWYINAGYATRWFTDSKPYRVSTGQGLIYGIHGYTNGLVGETGFGLKASVSRSAAIIISLSGKVQESSLRYYVGPDLPQGVKPLITNKNAHGLYLSVGLKASVVF